MLLDASEVGPDFQPARSDDTSDPLPCTPSEPPAEDQIDNLENDRISFANSTGDVEVSEQISAYGSETDAVRYQ